MAIASPSDAYSAAHPFASRFPQDSPYRAEQRLDVELILHRKRMHYAS